MAHRLQSHIVLGEPHLKKSINVSGSHVSVLRRLHISTNHEKATARKA